MRDYDINTVAGRVRYFRELRAQGDLSGLDMFNFAARWPAQDNQWAREADSWPGLQSHPGWQSFLNAAAIRELTRGEAGEHSRASDPGLCSHCEKPATVLVPWPRGAICVECMDTQVDLLARAVTDPDGRPVVAA